MSGVFSHSLQPVFICLWQGLLLNPLFIIPAKLAAQWTSRIYLELYFSTGVARLHSHPKGGRLSVTIGSHCVVLASLEITMQSRLALDTQISWHTLAYWLRCENKTNQSMDSGDPNTGPHPCTSTLATDACPQSIQGVRHDSDPLPHERSTSLCIRHFEKHRDRGRGGENPLCLT